MTEQIEGFSNDDPDEKYKIDMLLGEGSYGAVYRVFDDSSDLIAMKVLKIEEDYCKSIFFVIF